MKRRLDIWNSFNNNSNTLSLWSYMILEIQNSILKSNTVFNLDAQHLISSSITKTVLGSWQCTSTSFLYQRSIVLMVHNECDSLGKKIGVACTAFLPNVWSKNSHLLHWRCDGSVVLSDNFSIWHVERIWSYLSPAQHVKQISWRQGSSSIQRQNETPTVIMVCNGCNILK